MNKDWLDFLSANNAIISETNGFDFPSSGRTSESISAIANLAVLQIAGKDSSQFLQGQLACDINELTDKNSFFTVFCNAKGRAISTLLVLQNEQGFLLILPKQLIEKVSKKLQMYILRSDVQLHNVSDKFCLMGLSTDNKDLFNTLPEANFEVSNNEVLMLKLPSASHRYLIIASTDKAQPFWSEITEDHNMTPCSSNSWDYQDISAGIPWLTQQSSEEFIPQMLNIDKLGGISFNKGCYTGQEIIARTHYLGKAKRALYLAECSIDAKLDTNTHIIFDKTVQSNSQILSFQTNKLQQRILLVMPTSDAELKNLILNTPNQDKISVIDFQ